jgi:erythromycin esterase-like protein
MPLQYQDKDRLVKEIRHFAQEITGSEQDYDALMEDIGDSSIVLLGEASHGSEEFYDERARITQRLIRQKGFSAVALEADWPDVRRIHQYLHLLQAEDSPASALGNFKRFPLWMWRNREMEKLVEWLHRWNQGLAMDQGIAVYGLDLYSLHASIDAVLRYLDKVDSQAASKARERYACFDHSGSNMQDYGFKTAYGLEETCENEVVEQLTELRQKACDYANRDGQLAKDDFFNAEMNATVAQDAEEYYRSMFVGRKSSWNLRDTHMSQTLEALLQHLKQSNRPEKVIVWAHNSHIGDARATEMGQQGELNIGQLCREKYPYQVYSVGFTTHEGTVTAASNWDELATVKTVRPSRSDSWENLFHQVGLPAFRVKLSDPVVKKMLNFTQLERAIGVVYRPETERQSHYFEARLCEQFDSVIHIDKTKAVIPLDVPEVWAPVQDDEVPETFPSAL